MRQFLVAEARPGATLEIAGSDYHYLVHVLRLHSGAVIPVADAAGRRAHATVTDTGGGRVRLRVGAERPAAAAIAAPQAVTLIQALPKGALMDRIVRQATELGAARIVPVVAERTQGRGDPAADARRRRRWQRIARQAAQQSGSEPPPIDPPQPLHRYLEHAAVDGLGLLFQYGAAPLPAALPVRAPDPAQPGAETAAHDRRPAVRCAVGPEGGFSPAEAASLVERGFRPVGLPGGVLRVDTAVVAALTAVQQFLAAVHPCQNGTVWEICAHSGINRPMQEV